VQQENSGHNTSDVGPERKKASKSTGRLQELNQTLQEEANCLAEKVFIFQTNIHLLSDLVSIVELPNFQERSLLIQVETLESKRNEVEYRLHEKEQQLHAAQGEVKGLRETVGRMEEELLALQRENAQLLKSKKGKETKRTKDLLCCGNADSVHTENFEVEGVLKQVEYQPAKLVKQVGNEENSHSTVGHPH